MGSWFQRTPSEKLGRWEDMNIGRLEIRGSLRTSRFMLLPEGAILTPSFRAEEEENQNDWTLVLLC